MNLYYHLLNLRNIIDYPLRQLFRFRRKIRRLKQSQTIQDYAHLGESDQKRALEIEQRLVNKYHFIEDVTLQKTGNYYENVFYLHMLDTAFSRLEINLPPLLVSADIGTSHWFYVKALYAFLTWYKTYHPRQIQLDGYEVDAYRIYTDFHSRYDHVMSHIGSLPDVHFIPTGFSEKIARYDVITLFFPFVFKKDLIEWGLPQKYHQPEKILRSAWNSLKPGGILMVVNQGKDEHQAQKLVFRDLSITVNLTFQMDPILFQYDHDRYILAAIK